MRRGFISTTVLAGALLILSVVSSAGYFLFTQNKSSQTSDTTQPGNSLVPLSSQVIPNQTGGFARLLISPRPTPVLSPTPVVFPLIATVKPSPNPTIVSSPLSSSETTGGGLHYSTQTSYYSITGTTEQELRNEMNQKGSVDDSGQRHDAYTKWHITWSYARTQRGQNCSRDSLTVSVNTEIHLPKWENETSGSELLRSKWDQYIVNLTTHENGHTDLATNGGQEVYAALSAIGPYATCSQLDDAMNQKGKEITNKIDDQNKAYDAQTNYGATQGAIFP